MGKSPGPGTRRKGGRWPEEGPSMGVRELGGGQRAWMGKGGGHSWGTEGRQRGARTRGLECPAQVLLPKQRSCVWVGRETAVTPAPHAVPPAALRTPRPPAPPVWCPAEGAACPRLRNRAGLGPKAGGRRRPCWALVPCTPGPAPRVPALAHPPGPRLHVAEPGCGGHCPGGSQPCPWGWIGGIRCPAMPGRPPPRRSNPGPTVGRSVSSHLASLGVQPECAGQVARGGRGGTRWNRYPQGSQGGSGGHRALGELRGRPPPTGWGRRPEPRPPALAAGSDGKRLPLPERSC